MSQMKEKNNPLNQVDAAIVDEDVFELLDDDISEIMELLSEIPPVPVPDEFDLRLKRAIKQEIKKQKQRTLVKRLGAVAACLLIGVISYSMIQDGFNMLPPELNTDSADSRMSDAGALEDDEAPELFMVEPSPADFEIKGKTAEGELDMDELGIVSGYKDASFDVYGAVGSDGGGRDVSVSRSEISPVSPEQDFDVPEDGVVFGAAMFVPDVGQDQEGKADASVEEDCVKDSLSEPSRGQTYFSTVEEFNADCLQKIQDIVKAIDDSDEDGLRTALSISEDERYSFYRAKAAMGLYSDLFGGGTPTYSGVRTNSYSTKNQYDVSAGGNSVRFTMTATDTGVQINETVLDRAVWLEDKMKNCAYTLETYQVNSDGSVQFQVRVQVNEKNKEVDEVRYIVWNKTES